MTDKELIKALGGPAAVARHLGYEGQKGICRVSMWQTRGIPAKVRLENLGYFMSPFQKTEKHKGQSFNESSLDGKARKLCVNTES